MHLRPLEDLLIVAKPCLTRVVRLGPALAPASELVADPPRLEAAYVGAVETAQIPSSSVGLAS